MDLLDALSISDIILKSFNELGLHYISSLLGLGFDGASVMSEWLAALRNEFVIKLHLHIIYTAMDIGSL